MRIATWNVNSLNARLEKVMWWLDRAKPDILLMQETKLADADAPIKAFKQAGYGLVHHGEGRWNGVAIASRCGIAGVITNFGEPLGPTQPADTGDDEPQAEARMISAECGGLHVICIYAPNGRQIDSPFYQAKLAWFDRLARWIDQNLPPKAPAVIGGDFNVAPADIDVWDLAACRARRTSQSASGRRWPNCRARDSSMRTDCITQNQGGTPGGTTVPETFTRTSAFASITFS